MKTRFDSAEIWRTNNDTAVSIKELETSHLMNIVRMLLRRPETVQTMLVCDIERQTRNVWRANDLVDEDDAVMKERADISTRAQYVWALSMLQCGLPPCTVQRVSDHFEAVLDKYMEYQTEDLGDLFMRSMLHDSGVEVKATSRERKRKRK